MEILKKWLKDLESVKKPRDKWKVVYLIDLVENPEVFEVSERWYRTQMRLIDTFKRIKKNPTIATEREVDIRARNKEKHLERIETKENKPSIDEMEEIIIKRRIEKMRPDHTWLEVAQSLGISKKTLYVKRKELDLI